MKFKPLIISILLIELIVMSIIILIDLQFFKDNFIALSIGFIIVCLINLKVFFNFLKDWKALCLTTSECGNEERKNKLEIVHLINAHQL